MARTHILYKNSATGELLPAVSDAAVVQTSGAAEIWRGFVVEHHRFPPSELPERQLMQHNLALQISPPMNLEWKRNGRYVSNPMVPTDICLTTAGEFTSGRWNNADAEIVACLLEPAFVNTIAPETVNPDRIEFTFHRGLRDPQIANLLLMLKAEMEAGYPNGTLFGQNLATALGAHLLKNYSVFPEAIPDPNLSLAQVAIRRALAYIHDNLHRDMGLQEIADAAGLGAYYFAKQFRKATGQSVPRYVLEARIERAKSLLQAGKMTVAEVGKVIGFSHTNHFVGRFKAITGVSPGAIRGEKH